MSIKLSSDKRNNVSFSCVDGLMTHMFCTIPTLVALFKRYVWEYMCFIGIVGKIDVFFIVPEISPSSRFSTV